MEYNINDIYKPLLLDTFKRTISFFNSNNIQWWGCGGTMLGAVRHKGMIPWDDDIDLWVPREDYERLLKLGAEMRKFSLRLNSPELNTGYYLGEAKISDINTTIWEHRCLPFVFGVFIDIFPIDQTSVSKDEMILYYDHFKETTNSYIDIISVFDWKDYIYALRHKNIKLLIKRIHNRNKKDSWRKRVIDATRAIKNDKNGDHMVTITGEYREREYLPIQWFEKTLEMPFEDFSIRIPSGYDGYLSQLYGNYMALPPIEKRYSHHKKYYMNLKEGLTIEEVKSRIKNGEYLVY